MSNFKKFRVWFSLLLVFGGVAKIKSDLLSNLKVNMNLLKCNSIQKFVTSRSYCKVYIVFILLYLWIGKLNFMSWTVFKWLAIIDSGFLWWAVLCSLKGCFYLSIQYIPLYIILIFIFFHRAVFLSLRSWKAYTVLLLGILFPLFYYIDLYLISNLEICENKEI